MVNDTVITGFTEIDGLKGVNVVSEQTACCPLECDQCGGPGCRGDAADDGSDNYYKCCVDGINEIRAWCSISPIAPCKLATG